MKIFYFILIFIFFVSFVVGVIFILLEKRKHPSFPLTDDVSVLFPSEDSVVSKEEEVEII